MTRPSLRATVALLCAATVAIAIVAASVLAWLATRHTLREQVDASLDQRAGRFEIVTASPGVVPPTLPSFETSPLESLCSEELASLQDAEELPRVQLLRADGTSCSGSDAKDTVDTLPAEYDVARGEVPSVLRDATTGGGEHVRSLTLPAGDGYALQVTRSLEETDAALRQLAITLGIAATLGVLMAAAAGLGVARVALRPVDRLTAAAEHVAETEDLDVPIETHPRAARGDEIARLSMAFNAMTSRLRGSRARQRQLIADASHELRTPLTSLRTNLEWLMRAEDRGRPLAARHKRQVELAVLGQIDELATLIGEVSALAREEPPRESGRFALDEVVLRAVERAQRRDPQRRFDLDIDAWSAFGDATSLERAVLNLLDNALKFSDGPIGVELEAGQVAVIDGGPGLADAGQAFDRFWRAPTARELPGSGLGLAIVAETVAAHGGSVFFEPAEGGGSRVGFSLPDAEHASLTELSADPESDHTLAP